MAEPHVSRAAVLGGIPTKSVDVPITSVFLVLFVLGAVVHMAILQINQRRGHKFILSGLCFGFCMARIVACTMRLVWSTRLTDNSVTIAAQVFVAAGVIILFIVNLVFAQRIVRSQHPHWAWGKWFAVAFRLLYVSVILALAAVITSVVQTFETHDRNILRIDVDIQHTIAVYLAVIAFLPVPLLALRVLVPRKTSTTEKFGEGRMRTKVALLMFTSTLLTLGAAFRAGIGFVPRPISNPAWYHSKACFYLFNFTIEWTVIFLYAVFRVDLRFHVPNGSSAPGDYSRGREVRMTVGDQGIKDPEQDAGTAEKIQEPRASDDHPTTA